MPTTSTPTPSRPRRTHRRRPDGAVPAQSRVLDLLGRHRDDDAVPPELLGDLRDALDARLRVAVADVESVTPANPLVVGKSSLAQLAACEGRWQAEATRAFEWRLPTARGTVAHKAIELGTHWKGEADPGRLVDEALDRLGDERWSIGAYLRTLSTVERAELRRDAVGFVTAFEECFPPLRPRWRPVVEGRLRAELVDGRVVLAARPDLTLGRAAAGGKVIIDLKTGRRQRHHVDDLRFYALVDAVRLGAAPRRTATVYLDGADAAVEAVTGGVLAAAAERVVRSVEAMVEIRTRARPASISPNPSCAFCPAAPTCEAGSSWEAARDAGELDEPFWLVGPST